MRRVLAEALVLLVRLYQWTLRPFIGAHCRFEPSCSHYAVDALRRHGPFHGSVIAAGRVLRCNPWNEGGLDPVPPGRGSAKPACDCHPLLDRASVLPRQSARPGQAHEAMIP